MSILTRPILFILKFSAAYLLLFALWLPFAVLDEMDFGNGWVVAGAILGSVFVSVPRIYRLRVKSPARKPLWVLKLSLSKMLAVQILFFVFWALTGFWGTPDVDRYVSTTLVANLKGSQRITFDPNQPHRESIPEPPWHHVGNAYSQFPFLVGVDVSSVTEPRAGQGGRVYFFWFLGLKLHLQFLDRAYWFS